MAQVPTQSKSPQNFRGTRLCTSPTHTTLTYYTSRRRSRRQKTKPVLPSGQLQRVVPVPVPVVRCVRLKPTEPYYTYHSINRKRVQKKRGTRSTQPCQICWAPNSPPTTLCEFCAVRGNERKMFHSGVMDVDIKSSSLPASSPDPTNAAAAGATTTQNTPAPVIKRRAPIACRR